jgi:SanA protein
MMAMVVLGLAVVCIAAGLGWTFWTLRRRYDAQIYAPASLSEMPVRPVALVFGAGVWPNGALSLILRERMDAAIELYEAGRVQKLLLSGDNRIETYNEPAGMLAYALDAGVPREDIVLDYAGRRTYDTCYRARDIFGVSMVTLVTQGYHLPRALTTCRGLGIDAIGYRANRYEHQGYYLILYRLREIPALWLAWWDLNIARPIPVLGDPLPIFGDQYDQNREGVS